jgi:lipopolysaccharide/colanic/teichoic acid biosynthesis glycosyltransferase
MNSAPQVKLQSNPQDSFGREATVASFHPTVAMNDEIRLVLIPKTDDLTWRHTLKRTADLVFASLMLVVLFPAFLLVAIAVALDSKGGIIYCSDRVGKNGRIFRCLKFRTMHENAHQRKKELEHLNERGGVLFFKVANDPRVTPVGSFLRRYSLDELPQLWNVIRGDMSLVGPRPPLPEEYSSYTPNQRFRLDVIPGLTGMWQVYARQHHSFATCLRYDRHYINNWSLGLDCKILLLTIPAVFKGTGH